MIIDIELALIHANRQTPDFLFQTLDYLHNFVLIEGLKIFKRGISFQPLSPYLDCELAMFTLEKIKRKLKVINSKKKDTVSSTEFKKR